MVTAFPFPTAVCLEYGIHEGLLLVGDCWFTAWHQYVGLTSS